MSVFRHGGIIPEYRCAAVFAAAFGAVVAGYALVLSVVFVDATLLGVMKLRTYCLIGAAIDAVGIPRLLSFITVGSLALPLWYVFSRRYAVAWKSYLNLLEFIVIFWVSAFVVLVVSIPALSQLSMKEESYRLGRTDSCTYDNCMQMGSFDLRDYVLPEGAKKIKCHDENVGGCRFCSVRCRIDRIGLEKFASSRGYRFERRDARPEFWGDDVMDELDLSGGLKDFLFCVVPDVRSRFPELNLQGDLLLVYDTKLGKLFAHYNDM